MPRFRSTPIADAFEAAGAKERNPSWGELFWAAGRQTSRIAELEAKVLRLEAEARNSRREIAEWIEAHPRETVELLEVAGHIEPAQEGDVGAWTLLLIERRLPAGETSAQRIGPALAEYRQEINGAIEDDDDVVDAEIVE
jgi:hypothetical protein